jgi:hypothetical protein
LHRWRYIDAGLNLRRHFWHSPMVGGLTGNYVIDHPSSSGCMYKTLISRRIISARAVRIFALA